MRSRYETLQELHKGQASRCRASLQSNSIERLARCGFARGRDVALQVSQRGAEAAQCVQERCGWGCGSPEGGRGGVQGEHQQA